MLVTLACHLGQVGDHHHLGGFAELAQQAAHHGGGRAADPHIHFVEDKGRGGDLACTDHHDGEADTRQLAAGSHLAKGLDGLTRVGGDHELHPIDAKGREAALGIGSHLDGEAAIWHRQFVHAGAYLRAKLLGIALATLAQGLGGLHEGLAGRGQLVLHPLESLLVGVEAGQIGGQLLMVQGQLRRFDMVLACQVDGLGEAALQLVEALWIQFQPVEIAAQLAVALLYADQRFVEHAEHVAKPAVHADQGLGPVHGRLQQTGDGGLFIVIEQIEAIPALLHQLGAIGEPLMLLFNLFKLSRLKGKFVQLLHLVFDELTAGFPLLLLGLEPVELVLQLAPLLVVAAYIVEEQMMTGVAVQQGELVIGFEQHLVSVLTVDVDQQLTQVPELGEGDGNPVDIAARAPLGGQYPPDDALTVIFKLVGGEPGPGGRITLQQEAGTHLGLVAARAHHAGFGALPQAQPQSIDGDGFARPGLPGDAGHPRLQIELEKLDDGEVVDGQLGQHGLILYGSTLLCMHPVYTGLIYSKVGREDFCETGGGQGCQGRGMGVTPIRWPAKSTCVPGMG